MISDFTCIKNHFEAHVIVRNRIGVCTVQKINNLHCCTNLDSIALEQIVTRFVFIKRAFLKGHHSRANAPNESNISSVLEWNMRADVVIFVNYCGIGRVMVCACGKN